MVEMTRIWESQTHNGNGNSCPCNWFLFSRSSLMFSIHLLRSIRRYCQCRNLCLIRTRWSVLRRVIIARAQTKENTKQTKTRISKFGSEVRDNSNKCHASSNKCLTSSNKKLLNLNLSYIIANIVTTSKAPVTTSVALVPKFASSEVRDTCKLS